MRRLPIVVERAVGATKELQIKTGAVFEAATRKDTSTSCAVTCAHCCYHPFLITLLEGLVLYRYLSDNGLWTADLRKRAQEHQDHTLGLSFDLWLMARIPCPLLRDRRCLAYDARPLHCRVTYSTGAPNLCDPTVLGAGTPLVDNVATVVAYNQETLGLMKRLGVRGSMLPLSEALLLGEAITSGKVDMQGAELEHWRKVVRYV